MPFSPEGSIYLYFKFMEAKRSVGEANFMIPMRVTKTQALDK